MSSRERETPARQMVEGRNNTHAANTRSSPCGCGVDLTGPADAAPVACIGWLGEGGACARTVGFCLIGMDGSS